MRFPAFKTSMLGLLAVFAFARPIHALINNAGSLGLGAKSMGMGGATVAKSEGSEVLFWNAASLGDVEGIDSSAAFGMGGPLGPTGTGLGLAWQADDLGVFGVAYRGDSYSASSFKRNDVLLSAALPMGPSAWFGTSQRFINGAPGDLRGWSMDLGVRLQLPLPTALGRELLLGVSLNDAASSLVWGNSVEETQPSTLQVGLAWQFTRAAWLSAQLDRLDQVQGQPLEQWRLGARAAFWKDQLTLRAGATQMSGAQLYATAGMGAGFWFGSNKAQLDYAVALPSGSGPVAELRHLLSLSFSFDQRPPQDTQASMGKVLRDPKSKKIRYARIDLASGEGADLKEWELDITDQQGRVLRSIKGKGQLPPSVGWDGRSNSGGMVDGEGFSYNLRTVSQSGRKSESRSLLASGAAASSSMDLVGEEGSGSFGLRSMDNAAAKKGLRAKPALKAGGGYDLKGAEFELGEVAKDSSVKTWELRIVDERGRVVKSITGKGKPPKSLKWDGKDDLGQPLEGGALGAGFVLRTVDDQGKANEMGDELVKEDSFEEMAAALPVNEADNGPIPDETVVSGPCRRDYESGGWLCTIEFREGSTNLGRDGMQQVRETVQVLRKSRLPAIEISGFASQREGSDEDLRDLSQERADAVMKAILEGYEFRPSFVAAKGYGIKRSRLSQPVGCKVEVLIRD